MDRDLLAACDHNYLLATHAFMTESARGEIVDSRTLQISSCGVPSKDFNQGFLKQVEDLGAALDRTEAYFAAAKLAFKVAFRGELEAQCRSELEARGYVRGKAMPGMVLAPIREGGKPPAELEIREVQSDDELARFQATAFKGFGFPERGGRLFLTRSLCELPGVRFYLGEWRGEPVATSCLVETPGVAGIYWVATVESHRGRGLGEAMTWAAVRGGLERGAKVASLQASVMGEPVYARMGFETPIRYVDYARP